ncbi:MAG: hypothetical protein ACK5TH_25025 [Prosthecobacter sp.]|jgi:hypothetical protein
MREIAHKIGTISIQDAIGFSGHPGLCSKTFELPVGLAGDYEVTCVVDEIDRRRRITLLPADHECPEEAGSRQFISIGLPAGVILGEHRSLVQIRDWLDPSHEVWNQIACGFTDQVIELDVDPGLPRGPFALMSAEEYFVVVPHRADGLICGYTIYCDCDSEGHQSDPKWPNWEQMESRGELPATDNGRGVVKCPHCGVKFKLSSPRLWNGFRHLKCLGKIKLTSP